VRLVKGWRGNPRRSELEVDLTGVQYGYGSKQQIQLEKKEDMKRTGMASPDPWRCLVRGKNP
jgi:hypothetical protein